LQFLDFYQMFPQFFPLLRLRLLAEVFGCKPLDLLNYQVSDYDGFTELGLSKHHRNQIHGWFQLTLINKVLH